MKLEITPEPSAVERTAIERVLARALAVAPRLGSAWREAGVRESTESEPSSEAQAAARPRSRPGATRA
jgi:hypothetical protein